MAKELSKDYDVTVYSPLLGKMAEKISEFCNVTNNTDDVYDLGIINHNKCWNKVNAKVKVFTIHSKFLKVEQPPKDAKNIVGVTEYLHKNVIRNVLRGVHDLALDKATKGR